MSSAAEEAIQKAKAIAARLSGDNTAAPAPASDTQHALDIAAAAQAVLLSALAQPVTTNTATSSSTTSKRKRWGVADDTAEVLPGLEDAAKRLKAIAAPIQRRVWVDTSNKPAGHFASYISEGDKTKDIVELHPDLSIQLKGRGSSKNPPLPGMPEEPLHVLVEGPPDVVSKAEAMVEDLLRQAEAAPLQQSDEDPSSISEKAADALASTSSPGYTPAPVAALIHGTSSAGNHYGGYGDMLEEQIGVPNGVVGFIIGRGGENITSMQARSGCKIQIQKEHEMTPGQTQRVITLTATTKESIDSCRGMIESMVQDRIRTTNSSVSMASAMSTPGGGGTQAAKLHEALGAGHQLVTVIVPDGDVGLIIGRGGTTIRDIQDRSGANIQIPQQGDADNPAVRTVSITHPHLEGAQAAQQMIEQMLASKSQQNLFVPQTSLQVMIPDKDVGMCIGRSGCVIREMQNKTNTKIQIPSQAIPGQEYRIATVTGPADGCNQVKQMIERISLEQSSQSVMSGAAYQAQDGGYGGQYGQQQQQAYGGQQYGYGQQVYGQQAAATGGQMDYSAQWAAYYAAQAAAQGSNTAAAATATQAPAPSAANASGQQAADAYYEQFFRYAYYYGEDAARRYYGAWSPPVGTPNPYGENPAGITPAPASESAPAPEVASPEAASPQAAAPQAAAAATDAASRPRETSQRRGVSNLPAWMTKGTS